MVASLRSQAVQIILVLIVFVIFLANGSGLLEFQLSAAKGISLRSFVFNLDETTGLPSVIFSPAFIVLAVCGIALSVLLPLLNPVYASLLTAAAALPQLAVAYNTTGHSLLPMEFCLLTILVLYAINVLISYFRETMMRQQIVDVFGQYIPPELVNQISKDPEKLNLDGESKNLSVFFCDLQNFTGVSEQLNPKQLARLLNEYFTVMTEILYSHGATIDKYIGDSIMCFWGAPVRQDDHANRAVLASLDMQKAIVPLVDTFRSRGWPGPTMGIGINTGMMSVGNMGSKYRLTYTVVGDAVNLASRLEGLTRSYRVPTIVSQATRRGTSDILFRSLDLVQVKGKVNTTKIYEPICRKDEADEATVAKLRKHRQAMEFYYNESWSDAEKAIEAMKGEYSEDPYYPVMLDIIAEKKSQPAS